MKSQWFKRVGWFHVPVSAMGVLAAFAVFAFCVNVFVAIDRHSHSVSDTLYHVFPFFACSFLLFDWLARNTAGSEQA